MLYLNKEDYLEHLAALYLTLTSVVFEWKSMLNSLRLISDLTLTSVVFECDSSSNSISKFFYLTLTSVVFELF